MHVHFGIPEWKIKAGGTWIHSSDEYDDYDYDEDDDDKLRSLKCNMSQVDSCIH